MRRASMKVKMAKRSLGVVKLGSAILAASLVNANAFAQGVPDQGKTSTDAASSKVPNSEVRTEVVISGTRVDRAGFSAPTPVTVVSTELLVERAPSVLIDAIKLLPAARNTSTPTTGGQAIGGNGGGSFVNLRGLGPNRTLILLNGQGVIPTSNIGTVDIAVLPQSLVKPI